MSHAYVVTGPRLAASSAPDVASLLLRLSRTPAQAQGRPLEDRDGTFCSPPSAPGVVPIPALPAPAGDVTSMETCVF